MNSKNYFNGFRTLLDVCHKFLRFGLGFGDPDDFKLETSYLLRALKHNRPQFKHSLSSISAVSVAKKA